MASPDGVAGLEAGLSLGLEVVSPGHAYAVLGFDASTGLVHLWNPWGNDFQPQGEPGLESGYAVRGGHFFLPLTDFIRIFAAMHYETTIPARHRW